MFLYPRSTYLRIPFAHPNRPTVARRSIVEGTEKYQLEGSTIASKWAGFRVTGSYTNEAKCTEEAE